RLGPLHARGQRRGPAVQRLQHLDVEVVGERRVAADAEHCDGELHQLELRHRFHHRADGNGLAAAGAEMVLAHVDEVGREVVDQSRRARGWLIGGDDREPVGPALRHAPSTSSMRARSTATSRSGAMPNPALSRLSPPMNCTGARPRTARRTSSTIWPWLFSYTATRLALAVARATASVGKGNRVIGRT